jgi:hypothetical protein
MPLNKRHIILAMSLLLCSKLVSQPAYDRAAHIGLAFAGNGLHWSAHDIRTKTGFTLGAEYHLKLDSLNLNFIAEGHLDILRFDLKPSIISADNNETKMELSYTNIYLSFPLLARYYLGKEKHFYIEMGPYVSLLGFAHKKGILTSHNNDTSMAPGQTPINTTAYGDYPFIGLGIALGAGYRYSWKENIDLVFNVRNNAGLFSVSSVCFSIGLRKLLN